MRFRLTALSAAALIFIAGCSAATTSSYTAPGPNASAGSTHGNWGSCNQGSNARIDWWNCSTVLIEPLAYDGTSFSAVRSSCGHVGLDDAPVYKASSSGTLPAGTTTLSPACHGHRWGWWHGASSHDLYIVAYDAGSNDVQDRTIVAGPANVGASSWIFAPSSPGLATRAGSSYVFFVAWTAGPSATPIPSPTPTPIETSPPATFQLVAPLRWKNDAFSSVPVADCSNVTTTSAPPYLASSSGAFTISGSVTLAPNCAPGSYEALYLIAVQVMPGGGTCGDSRAMYRKRSTAPKASAVVDGWVIAGPANSNVSPWTFDTSTNEFVTQACATYAFFIGTLAGGK